ncbi:MAG: hypothetical protein AABO58_04540 [Acidobacteriota bacterium]
MIRIVLFAIQLGAMAVVLAASPRTVFDLDRFLVLVPCLTKPPPAG